MKKLIAIAIIAATTASSNALIVNVTGARKYNNGAAHVVEMAGNYKRETGEQSVDTIWIVMLDSNRSEASRAKGRTGTVLNRFRNWTGGVGDFRGAYYYAEFRVTTRQGVRYFRTPVTRW